MSAATMIPEPTYPEPLPLLPDMEAPARYPLEALGELLGGAAAAIVEAVQVPDALAAQSVLAAAAMAAQPHGNAQRDGQPIPLSLFALTVAESGDRKSAADRLALRAHHDRQSALLEVHGTEQKQYRDRRDAYQRARAAILEKAKGDPEAVAAELGRLQEPEAPPSPFILAEEPTLEGLQKSLLRGFPSQGLFSDEGGQFFGRRVLVAFGRTLLLDTDGIAAALGFEALADLLNINRTDRERARREGWRTLSDLIAIHDLENSSERRSDERGAASPLYEAAFLAMVEFIHGTPMHLLPDPFAPGAPFGPRLPPDLRVV